METPENKRLQAPSFSAHVARGLIRDPRTRRWTMFVLLIVAMLMVFLGSTLLEGPLNPREHVGWFLLFWAVCAWITITVLLLALFDVLALRRDARAARSALKEQMSPNEK